MITFNDIYEVARKERFSEQLQELPKNFIADISNYLKEKREIASKENNVFSEVILKTKKQLENAVILFKEIITKRKRKILGMVLIASETGISKKDFETMLDSEKLLFEDLVKSVENFDKKLNEKLNSENSNGQKEKLITFKEDVDEFVDFNGERVGPFKKGQAVAISYNIAKILFDSGKAEIIE